MKIKKSLTALLICFTMAVTLLSNGIMVQAVEKMSINHKKLSMEVGSVYKLSVKGTKEKIVWSSSNSKIVSVSSTGTLKGVKVGKATITAKVGTTKLKSEITILKEDALGKVFYSTWEGDIGKVKLTSKNIGQKMYDITSDTIGGYPATDYRFTAAIKDDKGVVTAYYKATHKEGGQVINEYKFKITVKGDTMTIYNYIKADGKYSKSTTYKK